MYSSVPIIERNNDIERESNRMKGVVSPSIYWVSDTISWELHLLRQGVSERQSVNVNGCWCREERREMWCVWGIGKQYSVNKRPARNTQTRPQEPSIMVIWWEHTRMINMQRVCIISSPSVHQVTRAESKLWIQSIPEKLSTLCPSHVIQSEWSESLMSILNYKRLCLCASHILSTI